MLAHKLSQLVVSHLVILHWPFWQVVVWYSWACRYIYVGTIRSARKFTQKRKIEVSIEFLHLFADWDPVETCIEPAGKTYLRTDVEQTDLFQDLRTCTQIYK